MNDFENKIIGAQTFEELEERQSFSQIEDTQLKNLWLERANEILDDDYTQETFCYVIGWIEQNAECSLFGYSEICRKITMDIDALKEEFSMGNRSSETSGLLYFADNVFFWENTAIEDFGFLYEEIFRHTLNGLKGKGLTYSLFLEYTYFITGVFDSKEERKRKNWLIALKNGDDEELFRTFIRYISTEIFENIAVKMNAKREYLSLCKWFNNKCDSKMYRHLYFYLGENVQHIINENTPDIFEQQVLIFAQIYAYLHDKEDFKAGKIHYYVSACQREDILDDSEKETLKQKLFEDVRKYIRNCENIREQMTLLSDWNEEE